MPYTFADIEPVKGVCISSWRCDRDGNELLHQNESTPYSTRDIRIVEEVKKLSQAPRLISGQGHLSSFTSDTRVSESIGSSPRAHKLRSLLHETECAFHAVLDRNSALESEVTILRARLEDLEKHFLRGRDGQRHMVSHELTPLPIGSTNGDESYNLNIFDISTPPRYKENVKPLAIARNHTSREQHTVNSNRRQRSLSVYNS